MVMFVKSDLEFILEQIIVSERHAAGEALSSIVLNPVLPAGLRTVDGSGNNLVTGQYRFGAADQVFPRATTPVFRQAELFDPDGPGPAPAMLTSYAQSTGLVVDSKPRMISNLIVDMTKTNPSALQVAGYDPNDPDSAPDGSLTIPNVAPDAGLSAPFNSWFTLFGQFFDHGLDLVNKGGSGTVFIPLATDDPLYDADGADNIPNSGDETNFMVLTRATNLRGPDGILGTADDVHEHVNQTTPFVDQNQTYTSHPSHQVFLREYTLNAAADPVSTGRMLDGASGGLATWAEVKAQARDLLGIDLADADVTNLPLLATDPYGRFIPGANGLPQLVFPGPDGKAGTTDDVLVEGNLGTPVSTVGAVRTGHAFLDDIAHTAAPRNSNGTMKTEDGDSVIGDDGIGSTYDDELLDAHFITGDGRGNENIGLTTVHFVFHAEHNRLVGHVKDVVLATGDIDFINEWLVDDIVAIPGDLSTLVWDGERVFQAARFGTEMQYQHLVFEEFARKIQPNINIFDAYETDINPAIVAEFAHTVYRFGHTMLNETIDRIDGAGNHDDIGLIEAFLNPLEFLNSGVDQKDAASAIIRGMTQQTGNEIDEFVVEAVRNNLLGLPLDLATINIARGRDTGVPSLNAARREFYAGTGGDSALKPYESWVDFGLGLRNASSLVNFVAAYGTHDSIVDATTSAAKRAAAVLLVLGGEGEPEDRLDFLNGTGEYANVGGVTVTGVDNIDLWVGGIAEKPAPFGGMLGSTFNFVFETQMEQLQDGDRFYYLSRTLGLNLFTQLEQNSFADLVMRNTNTKHLPGDVFSTVAHTIEVSDPTTWPDGQVVVMGDGTVRYTGVDHVVLGGTNGTDRMRSSEGDDTLWGDGGRDYLEGGAGNDQLFGGDGDDLLTDSFGDDVMQGGNGNDYINAGPGLDLILGGAGRDFIVGGEDENEVFAGLGDDIVFSGDSTDEVRGNEGHDWIEGGALGDLLIGDNDHPLALSTEIGHDVIIGGSGTDRMEGENGDDVFVGGDGLDRHFGQQGFDWVSYEQDQFGVTADLTLSAEVVLPPTPSADAVLDRFREVEGLAGSAHNDILLGDDSIGNVLGNPGLVNGLSALLGGHYGGANAGNIILGGLGSDMIEGGAGDDFLDGDASFNVRLSVRNASNPLVELFSVDSMLGVTPNGQTLATRVASGEINPTQLVIVREILSGTAGTAVDTARFSGPIADYDFVNNGDGTITITHARGTQADGSDTARNVERLQFADVLQVLSGGNTPAVGTLDIGGLPPTEGVQLSAIRSFTDVNGIDLSTLNYVWEVETSTDVWTVVSTATNFTPGNAEVGLRIRVTGFFEDGLGALESIRSTPTAPVLNVNQAAFGAALINDTAPTEASLLTADVSSIGDLDGLGTLNLQWQALVSGVWTNVAGATAANFTPQQAQVGLQLRLVTSFTDGHGTVETLTTAPTAIVGDRFIGSSLSQVWTGTEGEDFATGAAGNDTLNGLGGNDYLDPGSGTDIVNAGGGDDVIVFVGAADGFDSVDGGLGYDRIFATLPTTVIGLSSITGVEEINGTGATRIVGTSLANTFDFSAVVLNGIGSIEGGGGNDVIVGSAADDVIFGGTGNDTVSGGLGNDIFRVTTGAGTNVFNGGMGNDRLEAIAANVVITVTSFGAANSIEEIVGDGTTRILGNSSANVLDFSDVALSGISLIDASSGNDTVIGSAGNDVIIGGAGNDSVSGGLGNDVFRMAAAAGTDSINGGDGIDRIESTGINVVITVTSFGAANSIEEIVGDGTTRILGTSAANVFDFSAVALSGISLIDASSGNDTVIGSAGNDVIIGGAGNDSVSGGLGNDVFRMAAAAGTDSISGGDGIDRIESTGANVAITLASFGAANSIEEIVGDGTTRIVGTTSANVLDFSGTTLTGLANIDGGVGLDTITGSAASDVIIGGANADQLTGGLGSDVYRYLTRTDSSNGSGADTIHGFQAGAGGDVLDLLGVDANGTDAGNSAFLFVGNAAFSGVRGELRIDNSVAGITRILGDTDGNLIADFEIKLSGSNLAVTLDNLVL